jgi:uncharacterized damage-inducible protein DinB
MTHESMKQTINNIRDYFNRSTRPLSEEHSQFAPQEGLYTVAGLVAHVAQTIEWFYDGAFAKEWQMDFEAMDKEVRGMTSLAQARAWFERAVEKALHETESHSEEQWAALFPPNPIMGESPRFSILEAVMDHTAHHRGALTVYQRLLGLKPPMPYMEG